MNDVKATESNGGEAPRRRWLPMLNVCVSWTNNIVVALGSIVVTPAVLHGLGVDNYGIWLLITSFVAQMRILELGMTSGCMKYSSGSFERGDHAELKRIFSSSAAIFLGIALLALAATFVLSIALPSFFPELLSDAQPIILVLGFALAIDLAFRPYAVSMRARSYFFVYDSTETLTYLVFKLGLVLYLSHIGLSLWVLSLITLGECVIRNGLVFVLCLKYCPWTVRPSLTVVDRPTIKKLVGFSGICFIISLASMVSFQIDNAVIGKFLPDAARNIAIYGIGFQMIRIVSMSIGVTWSVLIPRFSGLAESGDKVAMRRLLERSTLVTGMFTVFALVSVAVFGLPFLTLWIDKPWVGDSYMVMMILLPGYFFGLMQGPANGLLWGSGKLKVQMVCTVLEALSNLALSLLLVGPYGIFGVCMGTAIPMVLVRGFVFPWVLQHECGITVREFLRMQLPVVTVGICYFALIVGLGLIQYHSMLELFPACVFSTCIFGVLLTVFLPDVRSSVAGVLRRTSQRMRQILG